MDVKDYVNTRVTLLNAPFLYFNDTLDNNINYFYTKCRLKTCTKFRNKMAATLLAGSVWRHSSDICSISWWDSSVSVLRHSGSVLTMNHQSAETLAYLSVRNVSAWSRLLSNCKSFCYTGLGKSMEHI